jgi:pyruvate-formate lyase-activating enzyme
MGNTRDYVADRRQYDARGRRLLYSGGWMTMWWDEARSIWIEGHCYTTKREALAALRSA